MDQIRHAADVLPSIIAALLSEVPQTMRATILARVAANYTREPVVPISTLFPSRCSPDMVKQIYNGLASMLQAIGMGGPTDNMSVILSRASSIASGQPFTGDPAAPTEDVTIPVAVSQLANSSAHLRGKSAKLDELLDQAEQLAKVYDCYSHSRYLGGSIFDGLRAVGQEIAGVFSEKKDLQGDYTRAQYRYKRDPTDERLATLHDAANALYSYLIKHDPQDDLLQDKNFLADVTITPEEATDSQQELDLNKDAKDGRGNEAPAEDGQEKRDRGGEPDRVIPDTRGDSSALDPVSAVSALQDALQQAISSSHDFGERAARSASARTRLAAALFWLNAPESVIHQLIPVTIPQSVTSRSLLRWCQDIIQALSLGSLATTLSRYADVAAHDRDRSSSGAGASLELPETAESVDAALSGVAL